MNEHTYIVTATQENFDDCVLETSHTAPVLVDFWASWCTPCGLLSPILHRLADEYQGKFILAMVNSDEQHQLASAYGVRSLPTVMVIKNGTVVEQFIGMQPESVIREIIERHMERESDRLRIEARNALQAGNHPRALSLLNRAMTMDPENIQVKLDITEMLIHSGEFDNALQMLKSIPLNMQNDEQCKRLRAHIQFAQAVQDAPDPEALQRHIQREPGDLSARYRLGAYRILEGDYAGGLEQLFEIMKRDRKFEDDLGHRGILAAFDMLGEDGALATQYRRKMAALLY